MHFTPKDQILLLSGLDANEARRAQLWSLPELSLNLRRLSQAGLVDAGGLARPAGVDAARSLRHITLEDLLAEHLPQQSARSSPSSGESPEAVRS
jgi:hypothetical protein